MYTLKACSSVRVASSRVSRSVRVPVVQGLRSVAARATTEEKTAVPTSTTEPDYSAQVTEYLTKAGEYVKDVWEKTADAEKPAAIAIIVAAVVAQIAVGATMDAVDKLPFVSDLFELIGVAVVATFTYKYVTDPSERSATKATIDKFVSQITGKSA